MTPESLAGLQYIAKAKRAPTVKAFVANFAPYGQAVLDSILGTHVEEVKGKLVINESGQWALDTFTKSE